MRANLAHHAHVLLVLCVLLVGCMRSSKNGDRVYDLYAAGVREPETISASEVPVADDEMVIGVSVGQRHRAYLVAALKPPTGFIPRPGDASANKPLGRHVVNDLIDGVPISVTFCDLSSCIRVFTGSGTGSLDLAVSGYRSGHMELILYRDRFLQNAEDAPLADFRFVHLTWKDWKARHPDTDFYGGHLVAPRGAPTVQNVAGE